MIASIYFSPIHSVFKSAFPQGPYTYIVLFCKGFNLF